jgi:hypothetical protein
VPSPSATPELTPPATDSAPSIDRGPASSGGAVLVALGGLLFLAVTVIVSRKPVHR